MRVLLCRVRSILCSFFIVFPLIYLSSSFLSSSLQHQGRPNSLLHLLRSLLTLFPSSGHHHHRSHCFGGSLDRRRWAQPRRYATVYPTTHRDDVLTMFSAVIVIGGKYWVNPGPFTEYLAAGSLGKFLGFWSVLTQAAYSFIVRVLRSHFLSACTYALFPSFPFAGK